jgi:hypothetical protein
VSTELAFTIALAVVACSSSKTPPKPTAGTDAAATTTPADAATPRPTPVAWPKDAPPSTTCSAHADCVMIVWDGPSPPDPCCDVRLGYAPMAKAYVDFITAYRAAHCTGAPACPAAPLPGAEPACCAGIARCVAGTCKSACDDPTATDIPKVSVIDSRCQMMAPPP